MTVDYAKPSIEDVLSHRALTHIRAFRRDAEDALPGRIAGLILFGSRARGDSKRGSDYDLAVVVRGLEERGSVDRLLGGLAYEHMLKGYHLSPVALPEGFLDTPVTHPLAMAVLREGIPVT